MAGTPTPTPTTSATPKPKPTFNAGGSNDSGTSNQDYGILVGFGLTDANGKPLSLAPATIESYIVNLVKKNPKAFANIKAAVAAATGKNPINDPNTLGAWVSRLAQNIAASNDPLVKSSTIEDFLRATAKSVIDASNAAKAAKLPTRQTYQYTPETREKWIEDVSQSLRGQGITEEDKQTDWYKNLRKSIDTMINQGTLSTTKQVKNPKTGKLETLVTQTPGFSQEMATKAAQTAIREADPTDVARKERVDFTNWLFKSVGGVSSGG